MSTQPLLIRVLTAYSPDPHLAAALSQCRHLARDDEQAGVCAQTFASHCATVLNETSAAVGIDGAFDALHTCAVLGAAGSACENVAATAAFARETAAAPRGLAVTADIAASAVKLNIPARFMWGWAEDGACLWGC
jgi:hypothetical protein